MQKEETTFSMRREKDAIEYLRQNQTARPFDCPHLLVAHKTFTHGNTTFEKGELLCTNCFLDICCIFSRAKADDDGRITARCSKPREEVVAVFKENYE
jgi:hypothetical protein